MAEPQNGSRRHKDEVTAVLKKLPETVRESRTRKLFDYNIVLIGFMGAGKSTISDFLRTVFAMEVVEMDQIIAEREGMSISDILRHMEKSISVIWRQNFL